LIRKYVQPDGINRRDVIKLDNDEFAAWTGTVSIGTPPREFTAIFDTGSADVVVPTSQGCNGCYQSVYYDPSSSSTSRALNKSFTLNYGSGGVSGMRYNDTLSIGGFTVRFITYCYKFILA
jgi:cathepsin D